MSKIEDFIEVNKTTLKNAVYSISKYWIIIFAGLIYGVLNFFIDSFLYGILGFILRGPLSIIIGFMAAAINAALLSSFLYMLYRIVNDLGLDFDDIKDGFLAFFRKVYGIVFLYWIFSMIISNISVILGSTGGLFVLLVNLSMFIFLNALPETIYLKNYDQGETIVKSIDFINENILNWFGPNIIFLLLYIGFNSIFFKMRVGIVGFLITQIGFAFVMVYRGHLYKLLSSSTPRKRMFMRKL